jgi:hypothetical protein
VGGVDGPWSVEAAQEAAAQWADREGQRSATLLIREINKIAIVNNYHNCRSLSHRGFQLYYFAADWPGGTLDISMLYHFGPLFTALLYHRFPSVVEIVTSLLQGRLAPLT